MERHEQTALIQKIVTVEPKAAGKILKCSSHLLRKRALRGRNAAVLPVYGAAQRGGMIVSFYFTAEPHSGTKNSRSFTVVKDV